MGASAYRDSAAEVVREAWRRGARAKQPRKAGVALGTPASPRIPAQEFVSLRDHTYADEVMGFNIVNRFDS